MVSLDHLTSLLPASSSAHQERSLRNPQPTEPALSSENWELSSLQPSPGKRAFTAVILFSSSHRGQGAGPVKYLLRAQPHAEGEHPDINQLQFLASSARQRPPTPPPRPPPTPPRSPQGQVLDSRVSIAADAEAKRRTLDLSWVH